MKTFTKFIKESASSSDIRDIAIHVNHVYGRNIVMVSASDGRRESGHWAVGTSTCGANAQTSPWSPEENHSDDCPQHVFAGVNRLAFAIGARLTPSMHPDEIVKACMEFIAFPCTIFVTNKCEKAHINVEYETAERNHFNAKKKAR